MDNYIKTVFISTCYNTNIISLAAMYSAAALDDIF